MSIKKKINNAVIVDMCTQRMNALKAHTKPKDNIAMNGTSRTAAEVEAIYQACLDSRAKLTAARAVVTPLMAERTSAEAARREVDRGLKPWVIAQFGEGSKEAIEFGFAPAKKAVRSSEEKATAVKLGRATRKARHTMGSKQKADIKGTLVPEASPSSDAPNVTSPVATVTTTTTVAKAPSTSNGAAAPINGAPAPQPTG